MCKKSLLMMLLLALLVPWAAKAQTEIEIGTGGTTTSNLPVYALYENSYSQQLFTAEEIEMAGSVTSISFFPTTASNYDRVVDIYMLNVDRTAFASNSEWEAVTSSDLVVANATIPKSITNDWVTIELSTPFDYDGTSTLLVAVNDHTGSWNGKSFSADANMTGKGIYIYRDGTAYDPTTITSGGYVLNVRNKIKLEITPSGTGSTCAKPTGLAISYTGGNTAEVSWNSEATAWNIDVNGTVTAITTNPYTLTGLEMGTTYTVKVQANCGGGDLSDWSSAKSFTTDLCMLEDMCEITVEMTDAYGDGGGKIEVVDALTNTVLATCTNTSASTLYTIPVCNGRELNFVFTSTDSWPYENGFVITDVNGNIIAEHEGCASSSSCTAPTNGVVATYLVDCPSCITPTNFTVSDITARAATLNWTSAASAWQIDCNGTISDVTEKPVTLSLEPETDYTVKVRAICGPEDYSEWSNELTFTTDAACPAPTNLAVSDITAFSANVNWTGTETTHQLRYVANPPMFFQGYVTDAGAMANGADASWTKGASTTWGPSGNYAGGYYLADDFTVNTATALSEIEVYGYQTGSTTESTFTGLYAMILRGNPMEGTVDTIWGDMTTNLMTSTSFTNCYRGSDGQTTATTRPIMAVTASGLNINLAAGTYWLVYGMTGSLSSGPWAVPYSDPVVGNTGDGLQHTSNGWTALNDDGSGAYGPAMKLSFGDIESFDWTTVNNISTGEYAMTNLDPETLYLVQVRANCGSEGNSNWVSTTFTTLPSCLFPTDLVVSDIEARQAVLAWTENGDATAWQVEVEGEYTTTWDATTNPYTLVGLEPSTRYTVKVRAKCSDTDFSEWSLGTSFTTAVACPAPTNLTVSDLTTTSATIGWTSYNETFDVWYREHVSGAGSPASNDFEGGTFGNWTTIDADGDGYDWVLGSACGGIYLTEGGSLAGTGHNASADLATSGSYSNVTSGALYPDNYLVSPQITLGGSITFWACGQDASYAAEHFGVAVSTTGNTDAADFTTIQEWTMTAKGRSVENVADRAKPQMRGGNRDQGTWYEYTVDLSAYSGQGYVAIRHFDCSDKFLLDVDDIVIVEPGSGTVIPDWIEANGVANPYTITGLAPETLYDVQVRSNCGGDDGVSTWLIGTFTTLSDCVAPWDLEVANITATTADLSWNGYKDSYDVRYYQLNTFFSADFENQLIPTEMVNDTVYPWTVTDTLTTSGYCIRSGNPGMSSSTSSISITVTFTADGTVEFDAECMGEGSSTAWDKCIFSIDSVAQFTYGAHVSGWHHYSFPVTAGEHTFTWSYSKDSSVNPTGDYFAIDNIFMGSRTLVSTIEGVTSPYTFTGLTPNTEYDVQVSGHGCDNWSEMEDFTTLPQTNVTQTIELVAGTNWFSTYVNITLADLKNALVAAFGTNATITIKSKDKNIKYQRGRWAGQLTEADWNLAKMYQIEASTSGELVLEGEPIDPTTLTLNIVEGTNWIAFPYNTSMTVTNLFTGFAINNDQVKSKDLNTKYNGRRWAGQLTTLEPGKGYWYVSPSTTVRTFVFPAAAK